LEGRKQASEPEELVRSRYSAFARSRIGYLMETCHPETRCRFDEQENYLWARESEWTGLEIISAEVDPGGERAQVEFKAHLRQKGLKAVHHEVSDLRRVDDRWYYYDGAPAKS
jgi:SEC-C motif-containing protein